MKERRRAKEKRRTGQEETRQFDNGIDGRGPARKKREITSAGTMVDSRCAERFKRLDLSDLHFVNGNSCIFEAGPGRTRDSCRPAYLSFQKQLIARFLSLFSTHFFFILTLSYSLSLFIPPSPLPLSYAYIYIHTLFLFPFALRQDTMGSGRGGARSGKSFPIT